MTNDAAMTNDAGMTQANIRTALVIGGGIAGPVAAMALQKAGIDAVVYEAYPSRADDAGGGLTLAPNGLDALDVIGLGDLVRPVGAHELRQACLLRLPGLR
jgi:2-polyprenyl-6-methoxyphenol hydroxylase-like FAD-dependent oxidoreductase